MEDLLKQMKQVYEVMGQKDFADQSPKCFGISTQNAKHKDSMMNKL